jgi:UDP-N-acetylmuramoyl-tripeptide--D-alanyl-D-alanine ligase
MGYLSADEMAMICGGSWGGALLPRAMGPFCIDSRHIQHGDVFVALQTGRRDGHAFLQQAERAGAVAALVTRRNERIGLPQLEVADTLKSLQKLASAARERFHETVIGITGSFGKTTVKELLACILGPRWCATAGNLNNYIGVPLTLLRLDPQQHGGAIVEAGINQPGEMDLLAGMIRPDVGIITGIGHAHLEQLGDLEGVAREKVRMLHQLAAGGLVFLPAQALNCRPFRELPEGLTVHVLTRVGDGADAFDPVHRPGYLTCNYNWTEAAGGGGWGELWFSEPFATARIPFQAGSPGMVSNLALAVLAAVRLGVPVAAIAKRLSKWQAPPQRGQEVRLGKHLYFVDCYNANPDSMEDSVQRFASRYSDRPMVLVLGGMNELGADAAALHRRTGARLKVPAQARVLLVGQFAGALAEGLRAGGLADHAIEQLDDLSAVRERLERLAGSAVLLKASRSYRLEELLTGARTC